MKALMRRPEHAAITAVRCLTPPPFDNFDSDALARAKKLAAEHGKPKTCDEGLRAIHAVLHVKTAEEAFNIFPGGRRGPRSLGEGLIKFFISGS